MNDCTRFRRLLEARLAGSPDPEGLRELGWHEHISTCAACREMLAQEEALELLLASLPEPKLPPALTARVLARLRARSEDALDRLLELDDVQVPAGLSQRVLAGVAAARAPRPRALPARPRRIPRWLAAAALLLVGVGVAWRLMRSSDDGSSGGEEVRIAQAQDEELIPWLEVLEHWEGLQELEPVEAEILAHFDTSDEAALEEGS